MACRLYVLTVLIETAVDLAIEGELLLRINNVESSQGAERKTMPVYLSIFALAQCVTAVHCICAFVYGPCLIACFNLLWRWMPYTLETLYSLSY